MAHLFFCNLLPLGISFCDYVFDQGHIFPLIALIYTNLPRLRVHPCHPWAVYPPAIY